jgi:hypothetical protein
MRRSRRVALCPFITPIVPTPSFPPSPSNNNDYVPIQATEMIVR